MSITRRHTNKKRTHEEVSAKGSAAAAVAGRTAYREEYQHDYGPDLDESLDLNEMDPDTNSELRRFNLRHH